MIIDSSKARVLPRQRPDSHRGFTLLEFGLTLLIFLFVAILAGWALARMRHQTRCEVFARDLQTFSAAFQGYHRKEGKWPAGSNGAAAIPPGMEGPLQDTLWLKPTPFGGNYGWSTPTPGSPDGGVITVTAFAPQRPLTASADDWLQIDAALDDGNISTGNFRTGFNGWPVYLIKP